MNKNNFNTIDKIRTPDDWKAKALNIPQTQIQKSNTKRLVFYRLATSFCLTIVCLISVVLFIHLNDALLPDPDFNINSSNFETTDFETNETQAVTVNQTQNIIPTDKNHTEETNNNIEPSEIYETAKPTSQATLSPTIPIHPTTKPTVIETTKPTKTPTQAPTSKPTNAPKAVVFNGSVKVEGMWVSSVDAYCKVFDSNGNLLGSNDLYDFQHEAEYIEEINNVEYYRYCASEKGLTFVEGYYTYVFYRRNGSVICSGTQYVS